jgi:hypothetical protein
LYDAYRNLEDSYSSDEYVSEGDFSERMSAIIRNVSNNFDARYGQGAKTVLSNAQVTQLLYMHDMSRLREDLDVYLQAKRAIWILFDNLDKGWPARGIQRDDLVLLKCLEEAARKLSRHFEHHQIATYAMIFLRQDVYELLVESTPDRGKEARVSLDWTDAELLREMLRRRFIFSGAPLNANFDEVWRTICVSHVAGEESSQFLIDRCLMRPRFLINLISYCRGYAVNLGHQKIEPEDIDKGVKAHSDDLVRDIGQEIRDVAAHLENILYTFIDVEPWLKTNELSSVLRAGGIDEHAVIEATDMLLWYGVLGILRSADDVPNYIYDFRYNVNVMKALIRKDGDFLYAINPAFWKGLAIKEGAR